MGNSKNSVVLRVSSSRDPGYVKRVAGAMTWQLRDNGFCTVRAVKSDAVNTAIKAIAIVNQRVSQAGLNFAIDLCLSPADSEDGAASTAVEMVVYENETLRPGAPLEYKVSGKKDAGPDLVSKLAGAVSSPARQGNCVRLRCIGPSAVYRGVMACCVAKGYIYTNGLDAIIVPSWDSLPVKDGEKPVSLIQLDFWGSKPSE